MSKKNNECPICWNHCKKDALQCERGQAYFSGNAEKGNDEHSHGSYAHLEGAHGGQEHMHRHSHERKSGHHGGLFGHGHSHEERPGHGFFRKKKEPETLSELLAVCGRYVIMAQREKKMTDETIFKALTEAEQVQLKVLLTKLIKSARKPKKPVE